MVSKRQVKRRKVVSKRHKYPHEAQQEINDLQRQLAEAREATRKAFDWALDITDEDFNSRDEVGNNNKIKQVLWEEYKEKGDE